MGVACIYEFELQYRVILGITLVVIDFRSHSDKALFELGLKMLSEKLFNIVNWDVKKNVFFTCFKIHLGYVLLIGVPPVGWVFSRVAGLLVDWMVGNVYI